MTLVEAIERLSNMEPDSRPSEWEPDKQTIKLGIEALKRIKKSRGDASRYYIGYLPGETER